MTTTTVTADDLLAEASWAQRLAQSLVGEDANDLVQDGYLAALEARPSSDCPIRPWLRRVLTNRAYNWTRARRRERARVRVVNHGTMPAGPSAEDLLARMEVQRTLSALVTALDEPYRQTVLLHFYEGLTSKQIEQLHGVPAGTVRWRLKEALDRLRRQLDEQHGGRRAAWRRLLVPLIPLPDPEGGRRPHRPGRGRPDWRRGHLQLGEQSRPASERASRGRLECRRDVGTPSSWSRGTAIGLRPESPLCHGADDT